MKLARILQLPADLWKAFREQVLHLPGPRAGPVNPALITKELGGGVKLRAQEEEKK